MKNAIILLLLLGSMLCSCSTYYFSTVKSYEDQLTQNEDGSYTTEKNGVSLTYSFRNQSGDIVYDIVNNSDAPYTVDWDRSVLIVEDQVTQIINDRAPFSGNVRTTTYMFGDNLLIGPSTVSGSIRIPQRKLFVTPNARVSYSPVSLFRTILNKNSIKKIYKDIDNLESEVQDISFEKENTPLKFKSYVTLVNDKDQTKTVFEDTFYIANYLRSNNLNPYKNNSLKKGNTFYFKEKEM